MLAGKATRLPPATLRKRYEGQLRRAAQSGPEDVFQIYERRHRRLRSAHLVNAVPCNSENFNIQMRLSLGGHRRPGAAA